MKKYTQLSTIKRHLRTLYDNFKNYPTDSTSSTIIYFELRGFIDGLYLSNNISTNAYNLYNTLVRHTYYKSFKEV